MSLNEVLCPPLPGGPQTGGVGECGITVKNDGPPQGFHTMIGNSPSKGTGSPQGLNLKINNYTFNPDGTVTATALPSRLALSGPEPFEGSCAYWDYEVVLNPHAVQPPSAIRLGRPAAGATTAWFAGSVTVAALFRFTRLDTHQVLEVPSTLTIDLAGRWTALLQSTTTFSPKPTTVVTGSLVLMVEKRAEWETLPYIASGWCQGGISCYCGHRLAFAAPQTTIDILNQ